MARRLGTGFAVGLFAVVVLVTTAKVEAASDDYSDIYTYVAGGLHHWSSGDASAEGLKLTFGQQFSPYMAAEVQMGFGGKDDAQDLSLERMFGVYGKFSLPLDKLSIYGKLGLSSVAVKEADTTNDEFEVSYGVGAQMSFNPNFYVDLEYMSYVDTGTLEMDGFTFSLGYKFK